jgi:hypothetical protein
MNFSLYYRKTKNEDVFRALEESTNLGISNLQNYVPLYEKFFSLNSVNFNNINLNQKYYLNKINNEITKNTLNVEIRDNSDVLLEKEIFCKFSPLLDPLKFLTGKYDLSENYSIELPAFEKKNKFPKLLDKNNSAYVDGFFTYLSSQLLHEYNFINSIDYYGAFIGTQENFLYNIADDLDYLNESDFFHEKKNIFFNVETNDYDNFFNIDSRTNKKKLVIGENIDDLKIDDFNDDNFKIFGNENSNTENKTISQDKKINERLNEPLNDLCIYKQSLKKKDDSNSNCDSVCDSDSESSCSSKSSNTCYSDLNDDLSSSCSDSGSDSESCSDSCSDSGTESEENITCSINDFPIQMICLEKCDNTLDYLMENNLLNNKEWISCLFQIIMSLVTYQKMFSFTHNDLHTNNIMFVNTDKSFIYYHYNNNYYKVPTFGKIYKLIDFGRAIYKFNGQIMCSDSFHFKGDAASQYNCEPYFNEKKPRLEPNPSFDLCRLACCIYDHFIEDLYDAERIIKKNKIAKLINDWLIDDKGRNILYKTDGEERYPEFKLYKMIARTIHNAIPCKQLENEIFKDYVISKKKINKNKHIMNIDKYPVLI